MLHTSDPDYHDLGYAEGWRRCLRHNDVEPVIIGHVPTAWWLEGPPVDDYDLVIPHVLVEEVVEEAPLWQAAALLELSGARMLNPSHSLVAAGDKLVAAGIWAGHGIPQPRTWPLDDLDQWPVDSGRRLVLKPAFCDGARHVQLVGALEEAKEVCHSWREDEAEGGETRGRPLLQEWIEEPTVLRIFATQHTTSLAFEKLREPGDLITSGAYYPKKYDAPEEVVSLATRMVAALDGGLMGLDILVDREGRLLALEANGPFGFEWDDPDQAGWIARAAIAHARGEEASFQRDRSAAL